jgi:hypothetical protein
MGNNLFTQVRDSGIYFLEIGVKLYWYSIDLKLKVILIANQ